VPRLLLLSLVLLGLSAVGASADSLKPDVSTWRWKVSAVLDAQRANDSARTTEAVVTDDFDQRYERYTTFGQPDAPRRSVSH
jgi:hypothetical protein